MGLHIKQGDLLEYRAVLRIRHDGEPMYISCPAYVLEVNARRVHIETRLSKEIRATSWHPRKSFIKLGERCREIATNVGFYDDPPVFVETKLPDVLPFMD